MNLFAFTFFLVSGDESLFAYFLVLLYSVKFEVEMTKLDPNECAFIYFLYILSIHAEKGNQTSSQIN